MPPSHLAAPVMTTTHQTILQEHPWRRGNLLHSLNVLIKKLKQQKELAVRQVEKQHSDVVTYIFKNIIPKMM